MTSSDPLYSAARELAMAAARYLTEKRFLMDMPDYSWKKREKYFELSYGRRLVFDVGRARAAIASLPEFSAFEKAVQADPVIGPAIGSRVASGAMISLVEDIPWLALQVVGRATEPNSDFDEGRFATTFRGLRAFFAGEDIPITVLVPFEGLQLAKYPLQLDAGTEIDLLSDEELIACINVGVIDQQVPSFGVVGPTVFLGDVAGLRMRRTIPPLNMKDAKDETDRDDGFFEIGASVERAIQALALLKQGRLAPEGYAAVYDGFMDSHAVRFGRTEVAPAFPAWSASLSVDDHELGELAVLWAAVSSESVIEHRGLSIALRRFTESAQRRRPGDSLVDLMIAAEALFSRKNERGDITYRLGMRAAFFLESEGFDPTRTVTFMKKAYGGRSRVVHGDDLSEVNLPGKKVPIADFSADASEYVRAALRKAVRQVALEGELQDFDDAIIATWGNGVPKTSAD